MDPAAESELARSSAAIVLGFEPRTATPIGVDRGVFSLVFRVESGDRTVVVKLPRWGANGDVARTSGAYDRERIAYASLLGPSLPVPVCHGIVELEHGPAFVLEDLSHHRAHDQLVGLEVQDALAVVDALIVCHHGIDVSVADDHAVRRSTPTGFAPEALARGLDLLPDGDLFADLLMRRGQLVDRFAMLANPVLCHGDPRADNLVLGPAVKLFDWQQIAIQAGEADLAWLLATSLTPKVRAEVEPRALARYAAGVGRSEDEVWERYRLAMIVPGLAVLLLAQRTATGRLQDLVRVSIDRIGAAVADHL